MANLVTYTDVERELAETASFRSRKSVALARRRADALERKLDFAESSDENGRTIRFNQEIVQARLIEVLAFIRENETKSVTEKLSNPDVSHADFSTFGQYGAG